MSAIVNIALFQENIHTNLAKEILPNNQQMQSRWTTNSGTFILIKGVCRIFNCFTWLDQRYFATVQDSLL